MKNKTKTKEIKSVGPLARPQILFVVDGNWYLHRCFHTVRSDRPLEEVLPYNLLSLVMKDATAVGATSIEVAFDGDAVFRYDIYPEYKSDRKKKKEEARASGKSKKKTGYKSDDKDDPVYTYLPAIKVLFASLNITVTQPPKHEADDVLRTRAKQYSKAKNVRVILGTKDKDNFQSLSANCSLYDSSNKDKQGNPKPQYITRLKAQEKFGVNIKQMIDYQTLYGDRIDSIPNLLGAAKIKKVLEEFGSIAEWMENAERDDKRWLKANLSAIQLNRKLVRLVPNCVPEVDLEDLVVPKQKVEGMPKSWYIYQDIRYPKSKGLFR